jgi:hypothetical protein
VTSAPPDLLFARSNRFRICCGSKALRPLLVVLLKFAGQSANGKSWYSMQLETRMFVRR